ncbi:helix-turn-helix domain-containing protein [Nannocystis pusilla]|uniref:helix-turn-helix domain-containing protein n=1 Tax=Nannocystis pusilla TaxID=889268 RepID=UPI003B81CB77
MGYVRGQRDTLGLTQSELASRSGVTPRTITKAESGRPISRQSAQAIAIALDATLAEVVHRAVSAA